MPTSATRCCRVVGFAARRITRRDSTDRGWRVSLGGGLGVFIFGVGRSSCLGNALKCPFSSLINVTMQC